VSLIISVIAAGSNVLRFAAWSVPQFNFYCLSSVPPKRVCDEHVFTFTLTRRFNQLKTIGLLSSLSVFVSNKQQYIKIIVSPSFVHHADSYGIIRRRQILRIDFLGKSQLFEPIFCSRFRKLVLFKEYVNIHIKLLFMFKIQYHQRRHQILLNNWSRNFRTGTCPGTPPILMSRHVLKRHF